MQDSQEPQPLEPKIADKYPYQEQKEQWGNKKFERLIVFGQGPVKPVLLGGELTEEQKNEWGKFKEDPLHSKEPNFRVIEGETYLSELSDIDKKELKRQESQNMGRFALNRLGRTNALAAGYALYLGITDKIILSGGKTISDWAKQTLPPERLKNWPSEAQLMKDVIVRRFGEMYRKQYGKSIEEVIEIDDASINTLENMMNTINRDPSIVDSKNTGVLGEHSHVFRAEVISRLFSIPITARGKISATDMLREVATTRGKKSYEEMLDYMVDNLNNAELRDKIISELRYTLGLTNEKYLTYWIGYFVDDDNILVTQKVLSALAKNEKWSKAAREAFNLLKEKDGIDIDFDQFVKEDLTSLKEKPEVWNKLREALKLLKTKYRTMPPDLKNV